LKQGRSTFHDIRGIRYHCREWGAQDAPVVFLLHGWMDVGSAFQFVADAMPDRYRLVAPDWRGFGDSSWTKEDSYWFPDYIADLDQLVARYVADRPVAIVGHSMGGNVSSLYCGTRPERIAKYVNIEGFGMRATQAAQAPQRYRQWLDDLGVSQQFRSYPNFPTLAARLQKDNPRLTPERAAFLARHWGRPAADGTVELRSDPRHKQVNPVLYRLDESQACWAAITAPVLWVIGAETKVFERMGMTADALDARRQAYRNREEITIEDAGHMIHYDQPERLAAVIDDFLQAGPSPYGKGGT